MNFKAFVSEGELEESRKTRQAEWEKVRKPDDPEEAPEPEYDPRSLFDRLQEQKIRKQEDFDESRRLKNLICVLDQDETSFLEMVDKNKMDEEIAKAREERAALEEFRKAIEGLTKDEQESKINEFKNTFSLKSMNRKAIKRPLNGSLANLIKLKSSSNETKGTPSTSTLKSSTLEDTKPSDTDGNNRVSILTTTIVPNSDPANDIKAPEPKVKQPVLKTCLVDYGSDSENESDYQEDDETNDNLPNKKTKLTE